MDAETLKTAIDEAIDARLVEHGLLTIEAEEDPPAAQTGKGKKGGGKNDSPPPEDPEDGVTKEALVDKLKELVKAKGQDFVKEMIAAKPFNAKNVASIKEQHFQKVYDAAVAALTPSDEALFGDY